MRDKQATKEAVAALDKAVHEYHATYEEGEVAEGSVPMQWLLIYSATSIDNEGEIIWGNMCVGSPGDPNTKVGLAMWGADMVGASTEDYDEED